MAIAVNESYLPGRETNYPTLSKRRDELQRARNPKRRQIL
jgi:hypothetical protein